MLSLNLILAMAATFMLIFAIRAFYWAVRFHHEAKWFEPMIEGLREAPESSPSVVGQLDRIQGYRSHFMTKSVINLPY